MQHFRLQEIIREELKTIKRNQTKLEKILLCQKNVLNMRDLSDYTGYSMSYIYKLTSGGKIPYFKPNGNAIFFERKEIDSWLLTNKKEVKEENNGRTIEV